MSGRGVLTIQDLRDRSRVDLGGCWHWLGAKSSEGSPRIYTLDYERKEKRSMSGAKAVWNIAQGMAPTPGFLAFRRCCTTDCVNPVHVALARNKAEIGLHTARAGVRKGTQMEQRRANISKAHAANGCVLTPIEIVRAIRAADKSVTGVALAAQYGISDRTVSRIRRHESHRNII
jgi:hypothetical protein